MFLDISEIYLVANSKGYLFQSTSYQTKQIIKESQDFKNLIDKCEQILIISQEYIVDRRWEFFNQESIINFNTILSLLQEGFEQIINEYIMNQQKNVQNIIIEQILSKYIELLRILQKKSKQLDIKIYFDKFIQKNFCLLFIYSDNLQILLDGIILYETFYMSQEEINEMQLEQQKFLYNLITSFIRKKIYMDDLQKNKRESIEIHDGKKWIEIEFFMQKYKHLMETDKPLYQISLDILKEIQQEKQLLEEQCYYVDRNFTEILTFLRINKYSPQDNLTLDLIATHMQNIKYLKCMDSLKRVEVLITYPSESEISHNFNLLLNQLCNKMTGNIFKVINDFSWVFNKNYFTEIVQKQQYQDVIDSLNQFKQNDIWLCSYLLQYYIEGIKNLKTIRFNVQEQSSKVNQIILKFELFQKETLDTITNTFTLNFNKIINLQAQKEDFIEFPDLTPYLNTILFIPETQLSEQMFLLLEKLISIYLITPEIFQNNMQVEINLYKLMAPFSKCWWKILNDGFFQNILNSINKKSIFNAHFIFNHFIYYALNNNQDQVINQLHQNQSSIVQIFKQFNDLGLITFLTNFNIIKKFVTNIINSKDQNDQIIELYIQIITNNIIMWGSKTGLDDHMFNLKYFNDIFTNHFLTKLGNIQICLEEEQNQIDKYLVLNKTKSNHSLLSYLLFINYKQKLFTENSMYFLNKSQFILQKKITLSFFKKVYYFGLICQSSYISVWSKSGTNSYSCIKQAIKSIKEIEESGNFIHDFLTLEFTKITETLDQSLDEGFPIPLLKQFNSQNSLSFLNKLINLEKITSSELMILQNLRKFDFIQIIFKNFLKQENKKPEVIQIKNLDKLLICLNRIEETYSLSSLRQYSQLIQKRVYRVQAQYKEKYIHMPDSQIEKIRKIENKVSGLLKPNIKNIRKHLIGLDKLQRDQINQNRINHFEQILINAENIASQMTPDCEILTEIYIVIYSIKQILSISFDQKNVALLENSILTNQFYEKLIGFLEKFIALLKSNNVTYSTRNEKKLILETENAKIFHLNKFSECLNELLENQVYHLIMRDLLLAENFSEKKIQFYKLLEQIFFFWHHYHPQSENLPQKISKYYEAIIKTPFAFQEDRLQELGIMIFNTFMQSTYKYQVRIRSCWIYKLIIDFISIKIKDNQNVTLFQSHKQPFILYFIEYLEQHFQNLLGDWSIQTHGGQYLNERVAEAQKSFQENPVLKIQSEQFLNFSSSEMDPVTGACTLAMICNLLSRLVQEEKDKEPELDHGVKLMFGQWEVCLQFLNHINQVLYHMGNKMLKFDECQTLDNDTFRYGIIILENILKLSDKSKKKVKKTGTVEQFNQLFDIMIKIVKNSFRVYENQISNFQNYKGEMVKISKFKNFMELLVISLYQSTDQNKIMRLVNEVLPLLYKIKLVRVEFEEWQNTMHVIIQQFFFGIILNIDTNFKVENGISVLRNLQYDQYRYLFNQKIKISNLKQNKKIKYIMVTDPHIFLFLMDKLCSINDEYIVMDLEKLNKPSLSHQPPDNVCLIINHLINSYVNDLKYILNETQNKDQDLYLALGCESSIKILIVLCTKFPLIIPYVLKQEVNCESLEKFLISKQIKLTFQQFLFEILPFSLNSSLLFIRFLISENCNYHFFKQENMCYFSSSLVFREQMIDQILQVLEDNQKDHKFLMTEMSVIRWQKYFCALNYALFQGNDVRQRSHHSENDYLDQNEYKNGLKFQIYYQRRLFYLKKTLIFLQNVLKTCVKNECQLLILRNCYFLDTFNQVYKGIVKNWFSQKTGLYYDDPNCNHKSHLNYYLNKMITNKFQIRQLVLEEIDNINTDSSIPQLIKYDKLLESFQPKCQIQANQTKIVSIFQDHEYKSDVLKTNFQFPLENFMKDFVKNTIIVQSFESNLFTQYLYGEVNYNCSQLTKESHYLIYQNNYFETLPEMKTGCIINKIVKHLTINDSVNPSKKSKQRKALKSFHETESEENKSLNSSVYSSQSKSKSYSSVRSSDSQIRKPTLMDKKESPAMEIEDPLDILKVPDQNQMNEGDKLKPQFNQQIGQDFIKNLKDFDLNDESDPQNDYLLDIFNWVELGFPKNALKLYDINIDHFLDLNEDEKYNLFLQKKNQFLAQQKFDFEAYGYPKNSLELYNINNEYFYSLPDENKEEVLEQLKNDWEAKNKVQESAKKEDKQKEMEVQKLEVIILRELECVQNLFIHPGKLNKNKQNYRPEIVAQICSKMQQLDEKSQQSLLQYFSDEFVQHLPSDLKNKIEAMKKEVASGSEGEESGEASDVASDEEMILDIANSSDSNESYSEDDSERDSSLCIGSQDSEEEEWESMSEKSEKSKSQGEKEADPSGKEGNMIMKDIEEVKEIADNMTQDFYENIPYLSDIILEALLNMLFCTVSDDKVENEENKLLCFAKCFQWISLNPLNSYRLIDCLTFLVQITKEDINQILVPFLSFPLSRITYTSEDGRVEIDDTGKHLPKIIEKIMYIISFLIGNYYSLPFYLEGGIYKHKQMQVKNTQDHQALESVNHFRSKFSDSDHKSLLKLSIEMIGMEDFSAEQIKSIIELVKSILELGIFEKSIEIEQKGYNTEFFTFLNQKLTKKKDLQYPNYSLDSSLLDNNFINTLSNIIVKNKISLKKDDNLACILDSLINIKVENFVRIFQGVFENYKEELYEKIIMLQKVFKTFQEENLHHIKDQHLNLQENLATNEDLFSDLCQDLYQKLETIQMDKEQFHYLRHFIVDMNYFFDCLMNKIIRRIFSVQIEDFKKQIDELRDKLEELQDVSQDETKKQERLTLKENFKKKKREFAKFLQEEKKIIKIKSQLHLKNILYNVPAINSLFWEITSLLNSIAQFVGNNNLENCPHLSNIYMSWHYACKSLIVFHALLNPSEHKSKQMDFNEMLFQQVSKPELDDEFSLKRISSIESENIPKLSKLVSSIESENERIQNEDQEKNMHSMDKTYEMLYGRLVPVITHFQNSKPDKTNHYEHYIRLAPNKQQLSLQMKLKFLRVLAIQEAKKKSEDLWRDSVCIEIDRLKPWKCTLDCLRKLTPQELVVKQIKIQFINEDGIDYGGLTREWLSLLSKDVFDPDTGLFQTSANGRSIQPNPLSSLIPDHLLHFRYLGRLIGKSLIDDWNMDINFTKSFLKHMLRKTLYVNDLQDIDPELSKNLTWMLENNMDDNDLGYDFSYTIDALGKIITIQLNEDQKVINEQNKRAYIKGLCMAKMTGDIENQAIAFIRGLEEIVPQEGLDLLSEQELGLHMAGMPAIDSKFYQFIQLVHDLKLNTTYYGGYTIDSNIIKWFWEIMDEYDQVLRADYLFFLSGSFKVPIGGFKNYPMKIEKTYCSTDNLPVAHTCFNQIDIPDYETKEKFKEKLTIAISEGQQGFYIG